MRQVRAPSPGPGTAGACQRRPALAGPPTPPCPAPLPPDPARLRAPGSADERRSQLFHVISLLTSSPGSVPVRWEPPAAPRVCKQAAGWCQRQVVVAVVFKVFLALLKKSAKLCLGWRGWRRVGVAEGRPGRTVGSKGAVSPSWSSSSQTLCSPQTRGPRVEPGGRQRLSFILSYLWGR